MRSARDVVEQHMEELAALYSDAILIFVDADDLGACIKVIQPTPKPVLMFYGFRVVCKYGELDF